AGNVYVTGYFQGTVDFDPSGGTANLTSAGGYDAFVAKYDANGNFVWADRFGGNSSVKDLGLGIFWDGAELCTTGQFGGTVDCAPSPGGTTNLTSAGMADAFVVKLNGNGDLVWARRLGGPGNDQGAAVTVDGAGDVLTTGHFSGKADFDPGASAVNLT